MIRGLDVSSYQGAVPWGLVSSELLCRFAIVKVAEGTLSTPDPWAARNLSGAKQAGLKVGGYFFFHPERNIDLQATTHAKLALDSVSARKALSRASSTSRAPSRRCGPRWD